MMVVTPAPSSNTAESTWRAAGAASSAGPLSESARFSGDAIFHYRNGGRQFISSLYRVILPPNQLPLSTFEIMSRVLLKVLQLRTFPKRSHVVAGLSQRNLFPEPDRCFLHACMHPVGRITQKVTDGFNAISRRRGQWPDRH